MTTPEERRGFWFTNRIANPVLRRLLRGPLGSRFGRKLAVLRYRGRRTGHEHELVVQYVLDGDRVLIVPGQPERKRWWRNMLQPQPVEVWLAGRHHSGIAEVIRDDHEIAEFNDARAAYRAVFSRTAPIVMVRVNLAPTPSPNARGGEPDPVHRK